MIDQTRQMEHQRKQIDQLIARPKAAGGSGGFVARASLPGSQSIAAGGDDVINYSTVDYDPFGLITTGAAWHYTVPVAGWYCPFVGGGFVANGTVYAADDYVEIDVYKNGGFVDTLAYYQLPSAAGTAFYIMLQGSPAAVYEFAAGDLLHCQFYNNTSASRAIGSGASIAIFRAA